MPKYCGELFVIRHDDARYWLRQARAGNPVASNLINCIGQFIANVEASDTVPICATCQYQFVNHQHPAGLMVILPLTFDDNDLATAVVSGICPTCAKRSDLNDAVMACARSAFVGPVQFHTHNAGHT